MAAGAASWVNGCARNCSATELRLRAVCNNCKCGMMERPFGPQKCHWPLASQDDGRKGSDQAARSATEAGMFGWVSAATGTGPRSWAMAALP